MKLLTRTLSLLAIASTTLFFASCKDDGASKKPEEIELGKLSKTWSIVSADLDNSATVDETDGFANFKLTISGAFDASSAEGPYAYSVSGSRPNPSPWPDAANGNGGSWTFGGTPSTDSGLIARDDGTAMTYEILDNGNLRLTFTFNGTGYLGARTAQVNGDWTFVFN